MKKNLRKLLSLFLVLLLTAAPVTAAASEALGDDLTAELTDLHQATQLSTNVFWSTTYSDLRTENLITYTPNSTVTPIVTYGSVLTSCSTVSGMARTLESQGYRVVAGLNGDFYNTGTGLPIGLVVSDGTLKSSDAGYYAIGFRANGSAVLGKPALRISADLGYAVTDSTGYQSQVIRTIAGVNKARVSSGGIYLYTYDFNDRHTTGTTEPGVDVVCSVVSGQLSIGQTVTLCVDSVIEASSATAVPEGKIVLSANSLSGTYYTDALRNMAVGSSFTVSVSASSTEWNDVRYGVGALYSLVEDGAIVSGLEAGSNPRTAVGQKADGTLIFYTIDGRQSGYSIGATLQQVAARLIELGCVRALCLDGGGSTTLTVTQPNSTAAATINRPSGGSERSVSNQIFLVAPNTPSGWLDHFYVSASDSYVLAGSKVAIAASAVDSNYIPMRASYQLLASAGTLTETSQAVPGGNGTVYYELTTPATGGDITVTASGGGRSGSTVVHAVATPDSITVKNGSTAVTSLTMTPGSSLKLTAAAIYRHQALKSDNTLFTWTLSGNIGTIGADGTLTAVTPGTGTLTVSAGGKSVTVAVTVSRIPLSTLEDFESGVPALTAYSYGATMTGSTAAANVQLGRQSGRLDYSLTADGTASVVFHTPYSFGSAYSQLNLWVKGDGSSNTLSVLSSNGSTTSATAVTSLSGTDFRLYCVTLPAGTASILGFQITGTPEYTLDESGEQLISYPKATGTLYLDQLTASYGGVTDQTVPAITLSVSGTSATAAVSDTVDGVLPRGQVAVTYDGKSLSFSYNEKTGTVTAALPVADGQAHRLSVFAKDASGNIGRASYDIPAGEDWQPSFSDTRNYWAATYVEYLYSAGVTTGYEDGTFRPNQNITRQQFAAMLFRYLGLDAARYENVVLPFADSDQIAGYAQTAVKALYSIGIISGTEVNGKLYFYPGNHLTRAQAAAMIGRTQEKGYAAATLTFRDAASIPAYALPYIQTMAAQGIINGYEDGSFKPNANITRGQMAKILYNLL